MILTIQFSNPYQRFQVENAFANLNLPPNSVVTCLNAPRWDELGIGAESRLDTIEAVRITEVTSFIEAAAFLQSLPAGAFSRVQRITLA